MEEANLASRAKAQELIQATNQVGIHQRLRVAGHGLVGPEHLPSSFLSPQILGHAKPPSALSGAQAPAGTVLGLPPGPSGYLLHGGGSMGLPLGGCSSSPPSPGGLAGAPDRREGSSSSDGRMDTDKVSAHGVGCILREGSRPTVRGLADLVLLERAELGHSEGASRLPREGGI